MTGPAGGTWQQVVRGRRYCAQHGALFTPTPQQPGWAYWTDTVARVAVCGACATGAATPEEETP